MAAYLGVQLLRVHDLPFMARVARMAWLLRRWMRLTVVEMEQCRCQGAVDRL